MNSAIDVVIIGAGASGIAASYTLTQLNVPHIIIESRDRIGGRINTTTIG